MRSRRWFSVMIIALMAMISACKEDTPDVEATPPAPEPQSQTGPQNRGSGHVPQATVPQASVPNVAAASKPKVVGKMPGGDVLGGIPLQMAYILWGGDQVQFWANGGLQTRKGTINDVYGLNLRLVPGDDMAKQIADYKSGKTPFLRGTYDMIGKHIVDLCTDPNLCPQVFLQMTWSAGDHLVCKEQIKDLSDLKGKKIAIQRNGPHEGFLLEILKDANLKWDDVTTEWLPNITGAGSPPEAFRVSNSPIACAFTVSPDMIGLTTGLRAVGDGSEGTVKGAHVLVSTNDRRRSIADVYYVSTKFSTEHPDVVRAIQAAYLKAAEEVVALKNASEGSTGSPEFQALMAFSVQTWGTDTLPNEDEAAGLFGDATLVGHQGNVEFFNPNGKTEGHVQQSARSNDLANALGMTSARRDVPAFASDWNHAIFANLKTKNMQRTAAFNVEATHEQLDQLTASGAIGDAKTLSFTAQYEPNQTTFDATKYKSEFDRVIDLLQKYSRLPTVLRCHTDTWSIVVAMLNGGVNEGTIQKTGVKGAYQYSVNGVKLNVNNAAEILNLIHDPKMNALFPQGSSPTELAASATTLSETRCKNAKDALIEYAKAKGIDLDPKQIISQGVGIREPFVVLPRSDEDMAANRRVEFSIVKVSVEATSADFDW